MSGDEDQAAGPPSSGAEAAGAASGNGHVIVAVRNEKDGRD